jgi:hypothetical protein
MKMLQAKVMKEVSYERPDTWVTVCTGHIGDTSSPVSCDKSGTFEDSRDYVRSAENGET